MEIKKVVILNDVRERTNAEILGAIKNLSIDLTVMFGKGSDDVRLDIRFVKGQNIDEWINDFISDCKIEDSEEEAIKNADVVSVFYDVDFEKASKIFDKYLTNEKKEVVPVEVKKIMDKININLESFGVK